MGSADILEEDSPPTDSPIEKARSYLQHFFCSSYVVYCIHQMPMMGFENFERMHLQKMKGISWLKFENTLEVEVSSLKR